MNRSLVAAFLAALSIGAAAQSVDYAEVDSAAKARALFEQGKLERVHLFPVEFGGADLAVNVVYLPGPAADAKKKVDLAVRKRIEEGALKRYSASPEYKGDSFIPSRLKIRAWNPESGESMNEVVEVW